MLKNVFKKIVITLLTAVTVWLLFGYSPSKKIPNDGKKHIQLWIITGQKEEIPYSVRMFNAVQDSIVIDLTAIPWQEHEKKILTAILSGNPPDLVSQFIPVAQWASRLALLPIDYFINSDQFDTTVFFPALWQEMKWKSQTFAIPWKTASYAFFYNNELFKAADLDPSKPPKTWSDVITYSKKLVKRDEQGRLKQMGFIADYGVLPGHGDMPTSILIAWQLGAQFLSPDGSNVLMTNPATVTGLEWVVNFNKTYNTQELGSFISGFGYAEQHAFLSNKVAMMCLQNTFIEHINLYRPDMDYTVCPIPTYGDSPTVSSSGSWWLGIPRGARHPVSAWKFMKFAVGKKTQIEESLEMEEPLFPANRLAANDPAFIKDEKTRVFVKQMGYAHSPAVVPLAHGVFWREYTMARERAVRGLQTPTQALAQAERQVQLELDKAVRYDNYVRKEIRFESQFYNFSN
jgi:ABC-type glycerol-3-phosphate transport system substrate-binding protein